ncbi:hypothetical protein HOD19_04245 [bacterium]|jgi:hypothetical protein|nr:hypothetical protein [bacterium]MBT4648760.1 hypothetical protein [bacterium]
MEAKIKPLPPLRPAPLQKPVKSGKALAITLSIIITFIVVAAGAYATYEFVVLPDTERDDDILQEQVEALTNQTESLQQQIEDLQGDDGEEEEEVVDGLQTYSNLTFGYGFEYPEAWNVVTSKYDPNYAFFGPEATPSGMALGGVELISSKFSLSDYLDYMESTTEIQYTSRQDININGVDGLRVTYNGFPKSGVSVLLESGRINIFINSTEIEDIEYFDTIVDSFEFLHQAAEDEREELNSILEHVFAYDHGISVENVSVKVLQQSYEHVRGFVNLNGEGGMFLAAKRDGDWTIVHEGNGAIMCSVVTPYNFPFYMIGDCVPNV